MKTLYIAGLVAIFGIYARF